MSTIILWLESPWQIRAFVFILAFLACFVAPYLYTAGKVGTAATRKSVQVENGKKPAAKAETPVHEAEALPQPEAPARQAVTEPKTEPPAKTAETRTSVWLEEAPHEQPQALVETPAKEIEAPAAPVPQEAAAEKRLVEPAPAVQPQKEAFRFSSKAASALSIPALGRVERQEIDVTTLGGSADVEIHVIPGRAPGRGLLAYAESDAFAKGAPLYNAVVCVGLGSRGEPIPTPELLRRADQGDFALCGILAQKPHLSENTKLYGLPLAQATGKKGTQPRIVVGIKSAKGDLADFATQRKMIAELFRENSIAAAGLADSAKTSAVKPARYVAVKRGKSPRKHKLVKPARKHPLLEDVFDSIGKMIDPESWSYHDELSAGRCGRAKKPRCVAAHSKGLPAGSLRTSGRRAGLFPTSPQSISRRICLKPGQCVV
jgi:hypothetical protein